MYGKGSDIYDPLSKEAVQAAVNWWKLHYPNIPIDKMKKERYIQGPENELPMDEYLSKLAAGIVNLEYEGEGPDLP